MRRLFALGLVVWLVSASVLALPVQPALAQDGSILGDPPFLQDGAVVVASGTDIVTAASVPAVDISSRAASASFFSSYYTAEPNIGWTGSQATCNAGTTSAAFKAAVIDRIAYYRAMAGVPSSIGLSESSSAADQQAALMFSRNNQLSHSPSSSWACYTSTGAQAAKTSNIVLGAHGVSAIDTYMEDPGSNNTAVGHRRWILYPQTQSFGTGDVPAGGGYSSANALWVIDSNLSAPRPTTRDGFVAWPPAGYVPYQVVFDRWSFSYPNADFGSASVSVTLGGATIPVSIVSSTANGYGENTIVFRSNDLNDTLWDLNPGSDKTYTVRVSNVSTGGQSRTFTYNVTVFDPSTAAPVGTTTPTRTKSPATATKTPTPRSGGYAPGDLFTTTTRLRLRNGPGTSAAQVAVLPRGATGQVTGSPISANGFTWYPVTVSGYGSGWAAGEYFARASSTATPTPTRTPTFVPTRTATKVPPTATRTPTLIPGGYAPGDSFRTTTALNMRNNPGTSATPIAILPAGALGQVTGPPVLANGYTWYPIVVNGYGPGWAAGEYFTHTAQPATATPVRTSTPQPPPTSAPSATRMPGGFLPGDTVRTTTSVNLRAGAGTNYQVVAVVPTTSVGTVTGSPIARGGYLWYPVTFAGTGSGWMASSYLALISAGNPLPTRTSTPSGSGIGSTVYTTANLNIRSGPGTGFSPLGVAPKGTAATITGTAVKVGSIFWFPLDVPAIGSGWASGAYLSPSPTVSGAELPATPSPDSDPGSTPFPAAPPETPTSTTTAVPTQTPTMAEPLISSPLPESSELLQATEQPEPQPTDEPIGDAAPQLAASPAAPTDDEAMAAESEDAPADEPTAEPTPVWLPIARIQRSPDSQPGQVLVDDDPSTVWFANGLEQPLAMFVLDLGQSMSFSQITWLTGDSGLSGTLYLAVSSDGENWIDLDPTLAVSNDAGWQVLATPMAGQYIRFVFVNDGGSDWLGGLAEVRILP